MHPRRASATESATDVVHKGPAFDFSHSRTHDSGDPNSSDGRNTTWETGPDNPQLRKLTGDAVDLIQTATNKQSFSGSAPNLTPPADFEGTMKKASVTDTDDLDNDGNTTETIEVYTLTEETSGEVSVFLGFGASVPAQYQGKQVERSSEAYQATGLRGVAYAYNSQGNVSVVTTPEPQNWRIDYSYISVGGKSQLDLLQVRSGPLATSPVVQKVEYTYFDEVAGGNTDLGSSGDLVEVKVSRLTSASSVWDVQTTQYRYYRSTSPEGRCLATISFPQSRQLEITSWPRLTGEFHEPIADSDN